ERVECMSERGRGARKEWSDEPEDADRLPLELLVAPEPGKAEQHVGKHGVSRRRRVIVEVLLPRDELLSVPRREEEAAVGGVAEEIDGKHCEPPRFFEPAQLSACDVELVQAVRNVGVILEHARMLRLTCTPAAVETALLSGKRSEQELAKRAGRVEVVVTPEPSPGLGESREREAVPGSDRLVVTQRLPAKFPLLEQPRAQLGVEGTADDETSVLERVQQLLRDVVLLRPCVGEPFDAVCV